MRLGGSVIEPCPRCEGTGHITVAARGTTGANILAARRRLGLKQQVVAVRADIALRTLARIESGEDCNVSTLAKIAAVLGVTVADLLIGEAEPIEATA